MTKQHSSLWGLLALWGFLVSEWFVYFLWEGKQLKKRKHVYSWEDEDLCSSLVIGIGTIVVRLLILLAKMTSVDEYRSWAIVIIRSFGYSCRSHNGREFNAVKESLMR